MSAHSITAIGSRPADEFSLLIPAGDVSDPELSIVIPALNESITIATFIKWCKAGLQEAGIAGEVLIVDSSTDETPNIAVANGARVLRVPKRGLGRSYIDALPYIRGKYVLLGDADCTYDFRQIRPFIAHFRDGCEYVMGSRWAGSIEPGSMPPLHRYLGTPVTTAILNLIYGTHFSDIHCGMRGITRDAFLRMDLQSQSWEYASEMILKSVRMELRTVEVPVRFLKDPEGRVSHHKRAGWFSPWHAAWINLRAMFVNGADFFLLRPGIILMSLGVPVVLATSTGPLRIGPVEMSLFWSLLGLTMAVVGLQSFYLGGLARVLYDRQGTKTRRWLRHFPYTPWILTCGAVMLAGFGMAGPLVRDYLRNGYRLLAVGGSSHMAITGLLLIVFAFMTFTFVLMLHAIASHVPHVSRALQSER